MQVQTVNPKRLLIVQHMEWEGPGKHLLSALERAGVDYETCRAWREPLPPLGRFGALVVLGGSPNVGETDRYPYLAGLEAAVREVLASSRAYLGFCLGHQLLAHVLGCRVGPLARKSVGFATARLTPEGKAHPAFRGLPESFPLFKWHGQGVLPPLPPEVDVLATSPGVEVEAIGFRGNPRILGLQFDNHAGAEDAARWLAEDRAWAASETDLAHLAPEEFAARAAAEEPRIGRWFRAFLESFLALAGLA
ncbi:MAG: type 1 glutamine amidotransferase [Planctomycetota bacterium]